MLALFGGSFDPPHIGHVNGVSNAQRELNIEELVFLPCAQSPLKQVSNANDEQRLHMLQLTCNALNKQNKAHYTVDDIELHLDKPTYTINTLKHLRNKLGYRRPIVFILGEDSFNSLPLWKEWQQLCDYCHLLVMPRHHSGIHINPNFSQWLQPKTVSDPRQLNTSASGHIFLSDSQLTTISSSEIRDMIRSEMNAAHTWLLPSVAEYIINQNLYAKE